MKLSETRECYAVIFVSKLRDGVDGYEEAGGKMLALAQKQPGYLGIDTARGADGVGITVSYWDSLEAIEKWREHAEHRPVQARGREQFYERYSVHVSRVVRSASFP
jgi:heme-degrading monooxygenase HmoA